jgi:transposase
MIMDKEDARYQKLEVLHERRKQAVRLYRKGVKIMRVVEQTGLSYPAVASAIERFGSGGWAALKPATRGRSLGDARRLSPEQEALIQKLIIEQRPEQLKLEFALWTRTAVMLIIERECGVKLPVRSVGEYLKRWGFTPHKPVKRAYEQRPEAVKTWLDEQYPAIEARAKAEGAEVHWADETALVNTDVRGHAALPQRAKHRSPVTMAVGGTRHKLSMISSVNNRGKAHWMIIDANFDAAKFIEFLTHLHRQVGKKVFVIVDNLRVHHSKIVKAWQQANNEKVELFYLPSYSPELNPDERLNADLKHAIGTKVPVRTKTKLREATEAHMQRIQSEPERVIAYFGDSHVAYAKA